MTQSADLIKRAIPLSQIAEFFGENCGNFQKTASNKGIFLNFHNFIAFYKDIFFAEFLHLILGCGICLSFNSSESQCLAVKMVKKLRTQKNNLRNLIFLHGYIHDICDKFQLCQPHIHAFSHVCGQNCIEFNVSRTA